MPVAGVGIGLSLYYIYLKRRGSIYEGNCKKRLLLDNL